MGMKDAAWKVAQTEKKCGMNENKYIEAVLLYSEHEEWRICEKVCVSEIKGPRIWGYGK